MIGESGVGTPEVPRLALVVANAAPEHAGLLDRLAAEHPEITFVRLDAGAGALAGDRAPAGDVNGRLPEPLTERELEILAYLPVHATSGELAARCYVSVNTLKTHMAHIYRKLGVTGRSAAIARARELGLLARTGRSDLIA